MGDRRMAFVQENRDWLLAHEADLQILARQFELVLNEKFVRLRPGALIAFQEALWTQTGVNEKLPDRLKAASEIGLASIPQQLVDAVRAETRQTEQVRVLDDYAVAGAALQRLTVDGKVTAEDVMSYSEYLSWDNRYYTRMVSGRVPQS